MRASGLLLQNKTLELQGKKNNFTYTLLSSYLTTLCNKRQINERKTNRSLLTCVPHVYTGDTEGKGRKLPTWLRIQN